MGLKDRAYSATAMVFPERLADVPVDFLYEGLVKSIGDQRENEDYRECSFQGARPCTVGGKEGREVDMSGVFKKTGRKNFIRFRFVVVRHRMFGVEVGAESQALLDSADAQRFLDSLRLPIAD